MNIKKRYWAFVCYPESLPTNWKDLLIETGLPVAISPLHDKDINPDNSSKKPHYHILLCYPSPTTFNNVNNLCKRFNTPIPIPLESAKGYLRYLTHKDNPEKYQYNDNDIIFLNGFCPSDYDTLTSSQINQIKIEILKFIDDNNITEYKTLLNILRLNESLNLLDVAMNHTILFNTYITSNRNLQKEIK